MTNPKHITTPKYNYTTIKHHNKHEDLVGIYRHTFCTILNTEYAVNTVISDSHHRLQLEPSIISTALSAIGSFVSNIPIIGFITSIAASLFTKYSEHQAVTKAQNFIALADSSTEFSGIVKNMADEISHKHEKYIRTLELHPESMKWIHKSLSTKITDAFHGVHYDATKMVTTLAKAHAGIMIKIAQNGQVDRDDLNMIQDLLEGTYRDEPQIDFQKIETSSLSCMDISDDNSCTRGA